MGIFHCGHVPGKNILWENKYRISGGQPENEEELVERKYCIYKSIQKASMTAMGMELVISEEL